MSRIDANRAILVKLLVVTIGMFGFGYALVPLYKKICEVTGINEVEKANAPLASTQIDRKSTRLNSSHGGISRMPSSA